MATLTDPVTGEVFQLKTRSDLRLRPPKSVSPIINTSNGVFCHHTVTESAPAEAIWRGVQNYHMDANKWSDIAYSYGVEVADGIIFEGRKAGVAGGHTKGYNSTSHAIVFVCNGEVVNPSDVAKRAYRATFRFLEGIYGPQRSRGHRDVGKTACPGRHPYAWIVAGMPSSGQPGPTPSPPPQGGGSFDCKWRHWKGQVLRRGATGSAVAELQYLLNYANAWHPALALRVDGDFGPNTEAVVLRMQRIWNAFAHPSHRIGEDGIFGQQSAHVLCVVLNDKGLW